MSNSNEEKVNAIQHQDYKYEHPLSHLYTITYVDNTSNEHHLYESICGYLDIQSLCRISCCNKEFNFISSLEEIWKPICVIKWPELKMATNLENDPFPIYKSCYKRKASQESTSMQDLMKIFGRCDWYSCPNGHLYAIGECRMAVMMSKCPECGASIGGRFHRHLDTNLRIGAVNSSYNPMRYGMKNEDMIQFEDVANAVHVTHKTGFGSNNNNNNTSRYNKQMDTISEKETNDWDNLLLDNQMNSNTICENETSEWDKLKQQFSEMETAPEYLVCPLSLDVFVEPMVTPNGTIYERQYIMNWLDNHDTDPLDANIKLKMEELEVEDDIKQAAKIWRENKGINDVGLKWGNGNTVHEEHTSDENWSDDNNDNEQENDVNMNEFKSGLTNALTNNDDNQNDT